MKTTDLMIGDWVSYKGNPTKIRTIEICNIDVGPLQVTITYGDRICGLTVIDVSMLKPIPLTREILEKNGFKKLDFSHFQIGDRKLVLDADGSWDGYLFWHWVVTEMGTNAKGQPFVLDYYVATINYVHELQHALKLCGIEKEVVL